MRPEPETLRRHGGELWCEDVAVAPLADRFGTPLYVYSRRSMADRFAALRRAFGADAHVCYAVKANGNLHLLRLFAALGAGFDVVSGGELLRLQRAGVPTAGAVFSGVAKQAWEVEAALAAGILFFSVEAPAEVEQLQRLGRGRAPARVALRLNPDVDAHTHDYVSTGRRGDKFGLDLQTAAAVAQRVARSPELELVGYHVHLGSQLRAVAPYLRAFEAVERFLDDAPAAAAGVRYYDLGGGFGVGGGDAAAALDVAALARELLPRLRARGLVPVLEPGRFLVADAGILVTRVLGTKVAGQKTYALVDAAMNDLLRPALYGAVHPVAAVRDAGGARARYDVVGPVCESADFLALDRELPVLQGGDLLSVSSAGAYGMSMASNYNARPRPAEVLVSGASVELIRRRERHDELWAQELGDG